MELNRITLKQVFVFIQNSVKRHAQEMKINNDNLQEIMDTMPPSNARSKILREIYEKNQEISKQNYELNALHMSIFKLVQANKEEFSELSKEKEIISNHLNSLNTQINKINSELTQKHGLGLPQEKNEIIPIPDDIEAAFQLTLEGKIELNTYHPFATNKKFLSKILRYYEKNELYEDCAKVAKLQQCLNN